MNLQSFFSSLVLCGRPRAVGASLMGDGESGFEATHSSSAYSDRACVVNSFSNREMQANPNQLLQLW
ncbi:hypothetical protein GOP47_0005471 [Adiantum capillus-veneris]|uniref:Uncharacterized protein n=1 Tax=Adiantum capillus-veneris TaxID=13818 RepID=A0A9D4V6T1_ADICA|nr:hypothetical protein GOP47_0005471 [Adiantum capillus-veneris]